MSNQSRFRDRPTWLAEFSSEILVVCPKCTGLAMSTHQPKRQLACGQCGFSTATMRVGPATGHARQRCRDCGKWLEADFETKNLSGAKERAELTCATCTRSTPALIHWDNPRSSEAREPYFGAQLYLTADVCGHELWAYNDKHAEFLLSFVEAKRRERTPNHNSSLASRLPKWMQASENRSAVTAKLRELLEKSRQAGRRT